MHKTTYDSVGTLTFCFDKKAYSTSGSVMFTARQGEKTSSPAELPAPVSKAPEDPNGSVRLNARQNEYIISAIDEHVRANTAFRIKANFKNASTGEVTSWDISVNAKRVENPADSDTRQFTFYSGFSSEYPVGAIDLTRC